MSQTPDSPQNEALHRQLEGKGALFAVLTTICVLIGGLAEIVPMYTVSAGPDALAGITPYSPLEVAGRDIYVREGCYNCHSQMIRPFHAETLRYGEWSRAGEYTYDRPFQLGSRRIGPDLQRVGGKYPDAWHYEHMRDPRSTTPGSVMPPYTWLYEADYSVSDIQASLTALKALGTPYTEADISGAEAAIKAQSAAIQERLRGAKIEAQPDREIIALIAYLQRLGVEGRKAIAEQAAQAAPGAK